jgi:two-component system LytT family sensor kinase
MLRYVLYDTEEDTITLEKEIHFLKEYLSLMQLRLTDNVKVEFTVNGDLKDANIAPMLFLPLVENAFKHGISGVLPCEVSFEISQNGNDLTFISSNTLLPETQKTSIPEKGIGLANTRRRLELLYPDRYSLTAAANEEKDRFLTVLKITL